ncbi:MAG: hypothetical protein KF822_05670 [Steroidobacteraceae bacterium]|nr:hypothetical protein [Steroidobacteraceae bacterium]
MRSRLRAGLALMAMLGLPVTAPAQEGALTLPRNLEQLTDRAATIVRGHVASSHVELHPTLRGLHTVVVTLTVRETLKGLPSQSFTFRQYVWDIRGRHGQTVYRKGDELLLLMIEPSEYGLSSPAGMGQGMFRIARDAGGREVAVNGHANARLFDGLAPAQSQKGAALTAASRQLVGTHRQGPIEASRLTAIIRELVDAGR